MNPPDSISISDAVIRYESAVGGSWSLHLNDILAIGEMTNHLGPFVVDYFFCFVTRDQRWVEASLYSDGWEDFFHTLSERFGPLVPSLSNSATFASNILWPHHLAGQPMFRVTRPIDSNVFSRLLGVRRNAEELTPKIVTAVSDCGEAI